MTYINQIIGLVKVNMYYIPDRVCTYHEGQTETGEHTQLNTRQVEPNRRGGLAPP